MFAIEFKTSITDGTIELPEQYRNRFTKPVRVIILAEEAPKEAPEQTDMLTRLLNNPLKLKDTTFLTREEIYERY